MVLPANRLNSIRACRAQTKVFDLTVKTKDGAPANLSGATIYFTAATGPGATPIIAIIGTEADATDGVEFIDAANGKVRITLSSTQTDVEPGCYRYDIWVEFPGDPPDRQCVASGELRIEPAITTFTVTV